MSEWISVKEGLPERDVPVLTTNGKEQHVAYWSNDDNRYYTGSGVWCPYCGGKPPCHYIPNEHKDYTFTHWMTLPKPPEES